jgi:hypothetical protein
MHKESLSELHQAWLCSFAKSKLNQLGQESSSTSM